jgi:hypothetical protein
MTLDDFKALTEAWGSDIGRWPEHQRAAAAALALTPEAGTILAEAQQIDQLITAGKPYISADRIEKVMLNVETTITTGGRRKGLRETLLLPRWLIPATSFACAAILGVSLGIVKPLTTLRTATHGAVLARILGDEPFDSNWIFR